MWNEASKSNSKKIEHILNDRLAQVDESGWNYSPLEKEKRKNKEKKKEKRRGKGKWKKKINKGKSKKRKWSVHATTCSLAMLACSACTIDYWVHQQQRVSGTVGQKTFGEKNERNILHGVLSQQSFFQRPSPPPRHGVVTHLPRVGVSKIGSGGKKPILSTHLILFILKAKKKYKRVGSRLDPPTLSERSSTMTNVLIFWMFVGWYRFSPGGCALQWSTLRLRFGGGNRSPDFSFALPLKNNTGGKTHVALSISFSFNTNKKKFIDKRADMQNLFNNHSVANGTKGKSGRGRRILTVMPEPSLTLPL